MSKNLIPSITTSLLAVVLLSASGSTALATTIANNSGQEKTETTNKTARHILVRNPKIGLGYYDKDMDLSTVLYGSSPFLSFYLNQSQQEFLNSIKPYCLALKSRGLLPSIAAAQAIYESGWGQSQLAKNGHNLFGVKGSYNGRSTMWWTQEFKNGRYQNVYAPFRNYPTWEGSFNDYANILTSQRNFSNIPGKTNYRQVANLLYQDGYATNPNYAQAIISIIEENGLDAWDQLSAGTTQESEDIAQIVYKPGYGVLGFRSSGVSISGSNYTFKDGTKWKTFGSKVINGEEMYLVGNNEYVPKRYTDHYDNGIVTIHYVPNYGVNALRSDGTQVAGSNRIFKTGTRWKIGGVKEINGEICYLVGNNEYIPKRYTQWGKAK